MYWRFRNLMISVKNTCLFIEKISCFLISSCIVCKKKKNIFVQMVDNCWLVQYNFQSFHERPRKLSDDMEVYILYEILVPGFEIQVILERSLFYTADLVFSVEYINTTLVLMGISFLFLDMRYLLLISSLPLHQLKCWR